MTALVSLLFIAIIPIDCKIQIKKANLVTRDYATAISHPRHPMPH